MSAWITARLLVLSLRWGLLSIAERLKHAKLPSIMELNGDTGDVERYYSSDIYKGGDIPLHLQGTVYRIPDLGYLLADPAKLRYT